MARKKPKSDYELAGDFISRLEGAINQENNYPAVLMIGGYIDECLDSALLRALPRTEKPPTTYARKSRKLRDLSMIDDQYYNDIRYIGYVRNSFAHSHLQVSFSNPEVRNNCNQLTLWKKFKPPFQIDEWNEKSNKRDPQICRRKFVDSSLEVIRDFLGKGLIHKIMYHQEY